MIDINTREKIVDYNGFTRSLDIPSLTEAEKLIKLYLIGDTKREILQNLLSVREASRGICEQNESLKDILSRIAEICYPQEYDSPEHLAYRLDNIGKLVEKGVNTSLAEIIAYNRKNRSKPSGSPTEAELKRQVQANLNQIEDLKLAVAAGNKEAETLREELDRHSSIIQEQDRQLEQERLKYQDLTQTFDNWLNELWGLLYPVDPTGWEYPAQVIRHIAQELEDKDNDLEASALMEMGLLNQIRLLREKAETLAGAFDRLEEINQKVEESLKISYERYHSSMCDSGGEVGELRANLRQVGLKAKEPLSNPCPPDEPNFNCKGCGKPMRVESVKCSNCSSGDKKSGIKIITINSDTEARPARDEDSKPPFGGNITFTENKAVSTATPEDIKKASDFIKDNAFCKNCSAPMSMTSHICPKCGKDERSGFTIGVDPGAKEGDKAAFDLRELVDRVTKQTGKDYYPTDGLFGIPLRSSPFMPKGYGVFMGDEDIKILKFTTEEESKPHRLKILETETERQTRIDKAVAEILKARRKPHITINVTVDFPKSFYKLRQILEQIEKEQAEEERQKNINGVLGKCPE